MCTRSCEVRNTLQRVKEDVERVKEDTREVIEDARKGKEDDGGGYKMSIEVVRGLNLMSIADRMLDTSVTTTYREMLAISPRLRGVYAEKLRTSQTRYAETDKLGTARVMSSELDETKQISGTRASIVAVKPLVSATTPQVKGRLDGMSIIFHHDPRSEVNVITWKIQEKCGLPIDSSP